MRQCLVLPVLGLCFLAASPGWTATVEVMVRDFAFTPAAVDISVGDTVVWMGVQGTHSVVANDGSFGSGAAKSAPWTYSHTFNSAGSTDYRCGLHPLMQGKVNVGGGGNDNPGTLKLSGAAFSVVEGNSVTLQVQRLNGDDGAVSVTYSVSAGTAQAADFQAASGTLAWAGGDDAPKSIAVTANEDAAVESNETVKVTLSNPTGGATIDAAGKSATVTILDDDDSSTSPPAAPANLQAQPHSTTEMMLSWTDVSGETSYRIEQKVLGGSFLEVATAAANVSDLVVGGLEPGTFHTFRVRATNAAGSSPYSNEASDSTFAPIAPCVPSSTVLCVKGGRFQVETSWRSNAAAPLAAATAVPLSFAPSSGLFYFFGAENIEMLVKVLNACVPTLGNKYWVFFAATTNVEFQLTVTDTDNGRRRFYFNPLNQPAVPVQDTEAFATCP